jgi:hypothetical protein
MKYTTGYLFVGVGILFMINALYVGPHGFGTGLSGVISSVIAGLICAVCGIYILARCHSRVP